MKRKRLMAAAAWMAFCLLAATRLDATIPMAADAPSERLTVFVTGSGFNAKTLEAQATFAEFIADRNQAGVVVQVLPEGEGYRIEFSGQGSWRGTDDRLLCQPRSGAPAEEIDSLLAKTISLGLINYAAKTPAAASLDVKLTEAVKPTAVKDPWHFWVFNLSGSAYASGEATYKYRSRSASLTANRVTPEFKLRLSLYANSNRSRYILEDDEIVSPSHSASLDGMFVCSLGPHWSAGGYVELNSSTYSNLDFALTATPAIEYNIFPYAESTKRQLRLLYRIGARLYRYREETIYDRLRETLWLESLTATLELKRKWGSVTATLEGSHYFHDLQKSRISLFTYFDVRLFKSLSFFFLCGADWIHDQIFLPKGEATLEEVLLQRRQLATTYSYFSSAGLSYTFGSTRSRVVNPRFGPVSSGGVEVSVR